MKRTHQLPKDTKNPQKATKKTMIKPSTKKRKNLTFRNNNLLDLDLTIIAY